MNTYKFFALEGLDGTGKSTIIKRLREDFPNIVCTREPGGSVFGEKIRKILLSSESKSVSAQAFLLAFMSARASHLDELIWPAMERGLIVVSDRFDASTFAFQLRAAQERDLDDMFWYLREEILRTDKDLSFRPTYIYLRITPELAATRRRNRQKLKDAETHFDQRADEYHQRVFQGYEEFFGNIQKQALAPISPSENPVYIVDASLTPDLVYTHVKGIVSAQVVA